MSDTLAEEYKYFLRVVETVAESDAQRYGLIDAARDLALAVVYHQRRFALDASDEEDYEAVRQHIEEVCK